MLALLLPFETQSRCSSNMSLYGLRVTRCPLPLCLFSIVLHMFAIRVLRALLPWPLDCGRW